MWPILSDHVLYHRYVYPRFIKDASEFVMQDGAHNKNAGDYEGVEEDEVEEEDDEMPKECGWLAATRAPVCDDDVY